MKFSKTITMTALAMATSLATIAAEAQVSRLRVKAAKFDPERVCDANAAWIRNIGLASFNDKFAYAFRMHKLCSTDTNAASFGLISGVKGQTLIGTEALGYDYKNVNAGFLAHCGAGAPRFNVLMSDGTFSFIGCSAGTKTESPRGTGWTQVRFNPQDPAQSFPTVPTNATIESIALVFDEGSDVGFNGSPEIVLENIVVNGKIAGRP